jgi:hypothetical protein
MSDLVATLDDAIVEISASDAVDLAIVDDELAGEC